jgi:UDP-glucose 4-epimerase
MVKRLGQLGCQVTTLDDLSSGHRDAVLTGDFVQGSIADAYLLDRLLGQGFDAVMHFASFIQVGESVQQPAKYYQNNVVNTLNLLEAMRAHGIQNFIFSSTAATFGEPKYTPIRKLPQIENNMKIEASISLRRRDEEVKVH